MSNYSNKSDEKCEVTLILFLAKLVNSNQTSVEYSETADSEAANAVNSSGYEGSSDESYENSELELVERTINYIKVLQKRLKIQKKTLKN